MATVIGRISRLEWVVAGVAASVLAVLVLIEPAVLEAPFENGRTLLFTFGGTAVAAVVLAVMLRFRVPPAARVLVLGVPFVAVNWWLLSPFFIDEAVDDEFSISIVDAAVEPEADADTADQAPAVPPPGSTPAAAPTTTTAPAPATPVLLGAGEIAGLAGHEGTGTAGFVALPDGALVLRLEEIDIQNGPDLRLYVVPGAAQTSPGDSALYLGELRGNVGNLTYDLPAEFPLTPGDWTVLVWCEAFSVEFAAATVTVAPGP